MTASEKQKFIDEIKAVCAKYGVEIAGTCEMEGIYGEITIQNVGEVNGWDRWEEHKFNFEELNAN